MRSRTIMRDLQKHFQQGPGKENENMSVVTNLIQKTHIYNLHKQTWNTSEDCSSEHAPNLKRRFTFPFGVQNEEYRAVLQCNRWRGFDE